MSTIKIYKKDKWVDRWVVEGDENKFSWLISTKAPRDTFDFDYDEINKLIQSGLSSTAKGIFMFLVLNRFRASRVCLYGSTTIARMYGCSNNTARRALQELIDNKVIYRLTIYTGKNVAYQYVIRHYKSWSLPENDRVIPPGGFPAEVIEYTDTVSKIDY